MSDSDRIWLQPECCADPDTGRLWCADSDPVDCEDGEPWIEYILASKHDRRVTKLLGLIERATRIMRDNVDYYKARS